jgi:hypothetical protein
MPMRQVLVDLVSSWGPMLLFIAIFLVYARRGGMQARAPSGRTMIELYEMYLEEMKRNTATLERIAQSLERRRS